MTTRSPLPTETIECPSRSVRGASLSEGKVLDRLESDSPWFIEMYLAVFSPIFLLLGWRLRKGFCRKAGGV
jgi:hypothetical protein